MRILRAIGILSVAILLSSGAAQAGKSACETIPGGQIVDSAGDPIEPGYDVWGYNYQARQFNGLYCNAYRDASWCQAYRDVRLKMKWNNAWLSTKDCSGDGFLDRHWGRPGYIGSGAWLTNHQSGEYQDGGLTCAWNHFVKIVAVPSNAILGLDNIWYRSNGDEIGPVIWGSFAIIQEVLNDPCAGAEGLLHKGARPGVGNWGDP